VSLVSLVSLVRHARLSRLSRLVALRDSSEYSKVVYLSRVRVGARVGAP
jgi:hypothetical protein